MFDGLQRRLNKTAHLMGFRISYAVVSGVYSLQLAAEQVGAFVANNIDLVLTPRGTSSALSLVPGRSQTGIVKMFAGGRGELTISSTSTDGGDPIIAATGQSIHLRLRNRGTGSTYINDDTMNSVAIGAGNTEGFIFSRTVGNSTLDVSSYNGGVVKFILGGRATTAGALDVPTDTIIQGRDRLAGDTTVIVGGPLTVRGGNGASGSAGAANGAHLNLAAGMGYGTGTRGQVRLGYDGANVFRVTVRNTILGLNGYTSTTADPTTTELATAGDFGIHKNTTSGTVFLAFNDAGTIKKVALT